MSKIIKYGNEAQQSVIKGIDTVADIVKTTIGPKGRNVLIRNQLDIPTITNDGVTIAKAIQLKDNIEDAGAALMISAANKTNIKAGDGTTTTTILTQEMIHKYYEYADPTTNPVQVQKEMVKASEDVSKRIKEMALEAKDTDSIKRVATVSSGSEEIGAIIAGAFESAGEYGSVIVEDSKSGKDGLNAIQGMKLPNGSVSSYLLADRINGKSNVFDVQLLVIKDKIDNAAEFFPILDLCAREGRKLLIMCDDIDIEPLNVVLMNKAKLNINIIRLPGFGELRENMIEDICLATGASLISRDNGKTLREFTPEDLGELEEIIITRDDSILKFKDTTRTGLDLKTIRINRCEELKAIMEKLPEASDQEQYKRRIANLISGVSVIEVGGNSEVEIADKKLRIEDAINSVQSAKEEGIVPGGGFSFLKILIDLSKENREGTLGERVVYNSLEAVTRQIAENAGYDGPEVLANCYNKEIGFNALTGEYENLIETGVINSAKVDRYTVINATSVASTVITMGGLVIEENQEDPNVLKLQAPTLMENML